MVRPEFVSRKLHLIADDLERLIRFKDETLGSLKDDDIKLAAVERMLERIVMRAIDINEHLISELGAGGGKSTRLTYRDTFLLLAELGVYEKDFAEQIGRSAGVRNILVAGMDRLKAEKTSVQPEKPHANLPAVPAITREGRHENRL